MRRHARAKQVPISNQAKRLLRTLKGHVGERNRIIAAQLARACKLTESQVEFLVNELHLHGIAVCGLSCSGYFMAANADDVASLCRFLRFRVLHALTVESKLLHIPLPVLIERIRLAI
jgi:hypothetical protein